MSEVKLKIQFITVYLIILSIIIFVLIKSLYKEDNTEYLVMSGKKELICLMSTGPRIIDKSKIKGFENDVWIFTNGYAKNCYVIDKNE